MADDEASLQLEVIQEESFVNDRTRKNLARMENYAVDFLDFLRREHYDKMASHLHSSRIMFFWEKTH